MICTHDYGRCLVFGTADISSSASARAMLEFVYEKVQVFKNFRWKNIMFSVSESLSFQPPCYLHYRHIAINVTIPSLEPFSSVAIKKLTGNFDGFV